MKFPEMNRHPRAALLFSGGKESVVLTHLLERYRDRIDLLWVNTGAMLPHMEEFVRGYGKRWRLIELKSDQPARLRTVGLPSRIVPIFNTQLGAVTERMPRERVLLTDWVSCCASLRGQPVVDYMRANGLTLAYHGQRYADNIISQTIHPASEFIAPLWDWDTARVFAYIEAHGLPLPKQYPALPDSIECWNCTAELGVDRIAWMKQNHPERMPLLRSMLGLVGDAVNAAIEKAKPGYTEALKGAEQPETRR